MLRHGDACTEVGIVFWPLPMDTLGAWSDTMVAEVQRAGQLGKRIMLSDLILRVAVMLAKINADMT